jgi:hypothetical protein
MALMRTPSTHILKLFEEYSIILSQIMNISKLIEGWDTA